MRPSCMPFFLITCSPSISRNARHHGACEDLPIQYVYLVLKHEWDCIQNAADTNAQSKAYLVTLLLLKLVILNTFSRTEHSVDSLYQVNHRYHHWSV